MRFLSNPRFHEAFEESFYAVSAIVVGIYLGNAITSFLTWAFG